MTWSWALMALLPACVIPAAAAWRGGVMSRLVATQLLTSLVSLILIVMTFAFDQPSFIDLPLALALLTLPGALLLAFCLERWV